MPVPFLQKLADRSLSPSLLALTRRLSRCREEAGVQHNRQEAHHRQDERPTPGRWPGAERCRAAYAAACSAPNRRREQGSGSKDPDATPSRRRGGRSITRSARHPPARSRQPRRQARQPRQGTASTGAAPAACTDRTRSEPEPAAVPDVRDPMAGTFCERDRPGRKSAPWLSELRLRPADPRLRACPGAP